MLDAQDDPLRIEEVYLEYGEKIRLYLTAKTRDRAVGWELHQEVFATALAKRRHFRGTIRAEEEAWLFAIARSFLAAYFRTRKIERKSLDELGIEAVPLSAESAARLPAPGDVHEMDEPMRSAMLSLPDDHRLAVELRVLWELEYAEIAKCMGISEVNARARVSRGQRKLKKHLAAAEGGT